MDEITNDTDLDAHLFKPGVKPPEIRELTFRSVVCGLVVAAIMGASYPYIVLKLGFGPNVSVVSAFFGYLGLGIFFKDYNRWENNMVQTAGTAAAQTAFMCVLLAAFDILSSSPNVDFHLSLTPLQSFSWLTTAGLLGVLMAIPMRQHFIVDEKLRFPDGTAAGETLIALDGRDAGARLAARALLIGGVASAALMLMTEDARVLNWFPSVMSLGTAVMVTTGFGINWSLLSLGSGMIIGFRVDVSMLIGALLSWVVAPYALLHYNIIPTSFVKNDVLFWVMWPATGMLVASGLTALVLRWKLLVKTFTHLSGASVASDAVPIRWVIAGVTITSIALVIVQKVSLGMPVWITVVAVLLSVPLMLVGLRVLGETNWGPISAMSNMMQGIFGILAPGHILANMVASGTTGTIAVESEAIMQDYRAGYMIGSSPRNMTIMQLVATPIGAAAVSWMYPLLRNTYGIVGENAGLSSPISRKWAGFAEILSKGSSALPHGALTAMIIFSALGIVLAVMESRGVKWIPSPTGMGIGMLVPIAVILVMFFGGVIEKVWKKRNRSSYRSYMIPLASGLIAGEAIVAVVIPLLVALGFVK
jgi:putative OPT family oligopeptide transporter